MLDFVIEFFLEAVGGVLEYIWDGVSAKMAPKRRARREKRQKAKLKSSGIE